MYRPALATAGTVLGIFLLLAGKTLISPNSSALTADSTTLAPTVAGTATGPMISTQYGPVQVKVTVVSGQITDVTTIQLPVGGKSGSIADYAAPVLREQALAAQGAGIQAVSGATYTSEGYATSLQAALDQLSAETAPTSTSSSSASSGKEPNP